MPEAKYILNLKVIGYTNDGNEIDLTNSRCEKCQNRLKSKNNIDAESSRFCDVMSSKIIQTRKTNGLFHDAIQIQFRCTPVRCHGIKSYVTLELTLHGSAGEIVSLPHQCGKVHFRTV